MSEKAPATDEEVLSEIEESFDGPLSEAMKGLYEVLRLQGMSVLEAYEHVSRALIGEVNDV